MNDEITDLIGLLVSIEYIEKTLIEDDPDVLDRKRLEKEKAQRIESRNRIMAKMIQRSVGSSIGGETGQCPNVCFEGKTIAEIEREVILFYERKGYSIEKIGKTVGLARRTIHNKLKIYKSS